MQVQHAEALAQSATAQAQRDEAIAERDEARRQRDEVLLAHASLQEQLKGEWASSERAQPRPAQDEPPTAVLAPQPPQRHADTRASSEQPSGVRVIPATRTVAAHLHRAQRDRDGGVTSYDMWVIRILGSVAAVAFISLLVMILKAFFVF